MCVTNLIRACRIELRILWGLVSRARVNSQEDGQVDGSPVTLAQHQLVATAQVYSSPTVTLHARNKSDSQGITSRPRLVVVDRARF